MGLNGQHDYIRSLRTKPSKPGQRSDRPLLPASPRSESAYRGDGRYYVGAGKPGKSSTSGLSEVDAETLRRAQAVHPISTLQTEYSLWSREHEYELFDVCRELGITCMIDRCQISPTQMPQHLVVFDHSRSKRSMTMVRQTKFLSSLTNDRSEISIVNM